MECYFQLSWIVLGYA
jgi:hypothetical protein